MRFLEWIWHIKGELAVPSGQSGRDVFDKLDPLFGQTGTSHQRSGDTLTFTKKDQAAQDKMSIFDSGVLQVRNAGAGVVLQYHLVSRALLFCFLAPLMFLGFAQLTIMVGDYQKASAEAAKKSEKAKKPDKSDLALPQSSIDKALGAPAPEKPKKDEKKDDKGPSPTPAYVFAAIFATLYVVGRILEDRLITNLFRKRLLQA